MTEVLEVEPITSLYGTGGQTWREWVSGARPLAIPSSASVADDICDAIGGANIAQIDCGDIAYLAFPMPRALDMSSGSWRTIVVELAFVDSVATVTNWATIPVTGARADDCEDEPIILARAMSYALRMFADSDDES